MAEDKNFNLHATDEPMEATHESQAQQSHELRLARPLNITATRRRRTDSRANPNEIDGDASAGGNGDKKGNSGNADQISKRSTDLETRPSKNANQQRKKTNDSSPNGSDSVGGDIMEASGPFNARPRTAQRGPIRRKGTGNNAGLEPEVAAETNAPKLNGNKNVIEKVSSVELNQKKHHMVRHSRRLSEKNGQSTIAVGQSNKKRRIDTDEVLAALAELDNASNDDAMEDVVEEAGRESVNVEPGNAEIWKLINEAMGVAKLTAGDLKRKRKLVRGRPRGKAKSDSQASGSQIEIKKSGSMQNACAPTDESQTEGSQIRYQPDENMECDCIPDFEDQPMDQSERSESEEENDPSQLPTKARNGNRKYYHPTGAESLGSFFGRLRQLDICKSNEGELLIDTLSQGTSKEDELQAFERHLNYSASSALVVLGEAKGRKSIMKRTSNMDQGSMTCRKVTFSDVVNTISAESVSTKASTASESQSDSEDSFRKLQKKSAAAVKPPRRKVTPHRRPGKVTKKTKQHQLDADASEHSLALSNHSKELENRALQVILAALQNANGRRNVRSRRVPQHRSQPKPRAKPKRSVGRRRTVRQQRQRSVSRGRTNRTNRRSRRY